MKVLTVRWCLHPTKAEGAYTVEDGPIADWSQVDYKHGTYKTHKIRSKWYDLECQRRAGDPAAIAQELDVDYLSSGYPVFSPMWSRAHRERASDPTHRLQPIVAGDAVRYEPREDGEFWLWDELSTRLSDVETRAKWRQLTPAAVSPERHWLMQNGTDNKRVLCCGVDAAEGLGHQDSDPDYSAIVLWDPLVRHPVGCLRSRILSPSGVAAVLADLADRCTLLLVIERNGPGLAVISTLSGLLRDYDQTTDIFFPIRYTDISGKGERQPGFRTTRDSKDTLIELIRYYTDPDRGTLLDRRLVDEYTVFAHLAGHKTGAPAGAHDDMVMALGLSLVAARDSAWSQPPEPTPKDRDAEMIGITESILHGRLSDEEAATTLGLR